jgi:peroxiredoxin
MAKLETGNITPELNAVDIVGNLIEFKNLDEAYVLLAFLRFSECPWCNLALHRLAMEKALLAESKCGIIAFIQSKPEDIQKSILEKHAVKPDFTIIADPDMTYYIQFGVTVSKTAGIKHHIRHVSSWIESVSREGFTQHSIDGNFFLAPAAILVSVAQKRVLLANYEADFYEHQSFEQIYDTIAKHQIYGTVD